MVGKKSIVIGQGCFLMAYICIYPAAVTLPTTSEQACVRTNQRRDLPPSTLPTYAPTRESSPPFPPCAGFYTGLPANVAGTPTSVQAYIRTFPEAVSHSIGLAQAYIRTSPWR